MALAALQFGPLAPIQSPFVLSQEARLYSPRLRADSGRQRQPAAPSHEHCGAPRVCNAEPRQRAAGAGDAGRDRGRGEERGRERRQRRREGATGGARATPTRAGHSLPPAASRGQPDLAGRRTNQRARGGASPPRDALIGQARRPNSERGGLGAKSANSRPWEPTAAHSCSGSLSE